MPVDQAVPLVRQFISIPDAYQTDEVVLDDIPSGFLSGERKTWDDLFGEYRVVILADAGAGKTHELKTAAERQASAGRSAFFIRIEDIREGFDEAFEIGSTAEFRTWLSGDQDAWFFLDAVDEIRLDDPRAFETAIRAFAEKIRSGQHRAHVYISSRPYAWRMTLDRALVEEWLPVTGRRIEHTSDELDSEDADDQEPATEVESDTTASLQLYQLAPLNDFDTGTFVDARGVGDRTAFTDALRRGGLSNLSRTPFDLQALIDLWRTTHVLGSRFEVLDSQIRSHLVEAGSKAALPSDRNMESAARRLAITSVLTGNPNFLLPGSVGTKALDPLAALPDWAPEEVYALLQSGLFGEPIYGEVRFRHREIRELLAAHFLNGAMQKALPRSRIETLLFRSIYQVEVVPPRLRPLLSWLILLDEGVRTRVMEHYPEIAVEGGDVAMLPLEARRGMLSALIERAIAPDTELRGLDNSALARIAQPDLETEVLSLIDRHFQNDDAIFILGRLAWQGAMRKCAGRLAVIAGDASRGVWARLVSVRVVACLGERQALIALWRAINGAPALISRRILAEFVSNSPADDDFASLLLASLDKLEPREQYEATGLNQALNDFVARAQIATLEVLGAGLGRFLEREPYVEHAECRISQDFVWLMSPALHCVERLIEARSPSALSQFALLILAGSPALRHWHGDDYLDRKSAVESLVPKWPELNDALFWWTVHDRRRALTPREKALDDDWPITWIGHSWAFDEESFPRSLSWIRARALADDRLVALSRSVRTYFEYGRPAEWLAELTRAVEGDAALEIALNTKLNPMPNPIWERHRREDRRRQAKRKRKQALNQRARREFASRLQADPEIVRRPSGLRTDQISTDQFHLLQLMEGDGQRESRSQGANWESLIPEFGIAVAEAYRDAAIAFWRSYRPGLRSEGADTSRIPYTLIFAMAGMDIELGDNASRVAALAENDAIQAARYALCELNGFPRWLEAVYRCWPDAVRDRIWREAQWELENSPAEPMHYALAKIVYYGAWLQSDIAGPLYEWLIQNHAPNSESLSYCRAILMGGGTTPEQMASLAFAKIEDPTTPEDQITTWYAIRTDSDPARALSDIRSLFRPGALVDPTEFGVGLIVALLGRFGSTSRLFGAFRAPTYLKELYILSHRAVRVADDIERSGRGVYSPTPRDDAQEARERLFGLLAEIPGELTYRAIEELVTSHPEPRLRTYMRIQAYRRAQQDGDDPKWNAAEAARWIQRNAGRGDAGAHGGGAHATA